MANPEPTVVLNRLLHLLCRSLPRYLEQAPPWVPGECAKTWAKLSDLAADQRLLADRVAEAVRQGAGQPLPGPFPMEFASLNDAALDGILPTLLAYHDRDTEAVRDCIAQLADAPERELAEEILGIMQRHRETLGKMTLGK